MLTGINGVGKTSILEGLYCLFSETRLDVSQLSRYNRSIGFLKVKSVNFPFVTPLQHSFNYKLFWDECPKYGNSECSIDALTDDESSWTWKYQKTNLSQLNFVKPNQNIFPIPVDSSTEFASWNWTFNGNVSEKQSGESSNIVKKFSRAQILSSDGGLYLSPFHDECPSICKFFDFPTMKWELRKLPLHVSKNLTEALQIINHDITDIRIIDLDVGLGVVLNDDITVTLDTIGNGAVAWASILIGIFDVIETYKAKLKSGIPILILIDEFCAGIHYSVMLDVWKFFKDFSEKEKNKNIQFVFTSHSDDCIRAFCEVFSEHKQSVEIVRLHKTKIDNKIVVTEYLKKQFESIQNGYWEIRG
jgi:hypothetical protein